MRARPGAAWLTYAVSIAVLGIGRPGRCFRHDLFGGGDQFTLLRGQFSFDLSHQILQSLAGLGQGLTALLQKE